MSNIWIVVVPLAAFGCLANIIAYCYAIHTDGGGTRHVVDGDTHYFEPLLPPEERCEHSLNHDDVP